NWREGVSWFLNNVQGSFTIGSFQGPSADEFFCFSGLAAGAGEAMAFCRFSIILYGQAGEARKWEVGRGMWEVAGKTGRKKGDLENVIDRL
ncbi:MAG: hypothetical protein ACLP9L_01730, partial [Thermoguttaceae bacterium]